MNVEAQCPVREVRSGATSDIQRRTIVVGSSAVGEDQLLVFFRRRRLTVIILTAATRGVLHLPCRCCAVSGRLVGRLATRKCKCNGRKTALANSIIVSSFMQRHYHGTFSKFTDNFFDVFMCANSAKYGAANVVIPCLHGCSKVGVTSSCVMYVLNQCNFFLILDLCRSAAV